MDTKGLRLSTISVRVLPHPSLLFIVRIRADVLDVVRGECARGQEYIEGDVVIDQDRRLRVGQVTFVG